MSWTRAQGGKEVKVKNVKGWPDRIIITHTGAFLLCEFKAPKKGLRPIQVYVAGELAKVNVVVHCVRSLEQYKEIYERACGLGAQTIP
jgi:hypothetical protein